ncbi:MAG TPA: maleylacetoacetate isomerase [Usitatibacter sp.]|nr:maleylacetoacetate isomerase [Usitatibacter sp.]
MLLYDYFRSSACFRVRIALNFKGLAPERRYVHLRKGEQRAPGYLDVNPQGLVPTLVIGKRRLTQSLAIMEFLEEEHPLPPLLPQDPGKRAWVRAFAQAIACDIHPLNNTRVLKYLDEVVKVEPAVRDEWYRHWIREGFAALESQLAGRPSTYCCGDTVTLADVCLVPQVFNAKRLDVDLAPYARIRAVFDACMSLSAFADAQPSRQPDAE